ncbi:MAG: hypothetical protein AAF074_08340 [Pseudomonadota bacterium]
MMAGIGRGIAKRRTVGLAAGLAIGLAGGLLWMGAPPAQAFQDPDWPCIQRKVVHLSWGQMWAGPPLPEESSAWRGDAEVAALAGRLAARRTSLEEAEALVGRFAGGEDGAEEARVVALFAGAFALIDTERARIVRGIERLARRERARSERLDTLRAEHDTLEASAGPKEFDKLDRIDELADTIAWETRIYNDRRRSLQFVCESPVILEKRAFALARILMAALEKG